MNPVAEIGMNDLKELGFTVKVERLTTESGHEFDSYVFEYKDISVSLTEDDIYGFARGFIQCLIFTSYYEELADKHTQVLKEWNRTHKEIA